MEDKEFKNDVLKNSFELSEDTDKLLNSTDEIKPNKKEEAKWSIEEEYLFFEGHSLIGNKWTFLNNLLPNKTAKQMKNHFYSSIVKTIRRIVRNKFELKPKDSIITYNSLSYLKQLYTNQQYLYLLQTRKDKSPHSNITLKKLILSKEISLEKINKYYNEFEAKIISYFKDTYHYTLVQTIPQMFDAMIKAKIIFRCISLISSNQICTEESCKTNLSCCKQDSSVINREVNVQSSDQNSVTNNNGSSPKKGLLMRAKTSKTKPNSVNGNNQDDNFSDN